MEELKQLLESIEKDYEKYSKLYTDYNGKNYDADYYLFLGKATSLGEVIDKIELELKDK